MKGVIAMRAPGIQVVDVSHGVPAQNVMAGALVLKAAAPYFPAGTVHVAVVDPGVGTARRAHRDDALHDADERIDDAEVSRERDQRSASSTADQRRGNMIS